MHLRKRGDISAIQVKGGSIDILPGTGIRQNRQRIRRHVGIVIVQEYLCQNSRMLERWYEILRDECIFLRSQHSHARRVLWIQWLVLYRDGVNPDAFGLHALDVFHQVVSIGSVIFRF